MSEFDASDVAPADDLVYRVRALTKSYKLPDGGRLGILDGLDLDVRRSELMLIEGKSGIGKSTLLHLLGFLDRPDRGEIVFDGRDLARASTAARDRARASGIGFVFQFFHLLSEFTAVENVMLTGQVASGPLAWAGKKRAARERAMELLDRVGIADRARHRPSQLSGGERQRVALARALFNRPHVLLCDEPTGNLDPRTSEQIHALLTDLNAATGQTMIVVSHDPTLEAYAHRVVRLEDGRALTLDPPGAAAGR